MGDDRNNGPKFPARPISDFLQSDLVTGVRGRLRKAVSDNILQSSPESKKTQDNNNNHNVEPKQQGGGERVSLVINLQAVDKIFEGIKSAVEVKAGGPSKPIGNGGNPLQQQKQSIPPFNPRVVSRNVGEFEKYRPNPGEFKNERVLVRPGGESQQHQQIIPLHTHIRNRLRERFDFGVRRHLRKYVLNHLIESLTQSIVREVEGGRKKSWWEKILMYNSRRNKIVGGVLAACVFVGVGIGIGTVGQKSVLLSSSSPPAGHLKEEEKLIEAPRPKSTPTPTPPPEMPSKTVETEKVSTQIKPTESP